MIKFLLKGILRDSSRSRLPFTIVLLGVALTIVLSGYLSGMMNDIVDTNARFETGHVKITTKAYHENHEQLPLDLAILNEKELLSELRKSYPTYDWTSRTKFGGLVDAIDSKGNSKGQGPAIGFSLDLFSSDTKEKERFRLKESLQSGQLPSVKGEALIGHAFAQKLKMKVGDEITFFGSTMNGSMAFQNFKISGTVRFGASNLDKGAFIIDLSDGQLLLDMQNATTEIVGFNSSNYDNELAKQISTEFNAKFTKQNDPFSSIMLPLKQQNNLGEMIDYSESMFSVFIFIFVLAMSIVLWNTGLIGGLRRYKEFGVRLAMGETKTSIYFSLITESFLIGLIGTAFGTLIGMSITYYMQENGISIGKYVANSSMLFPSVIHSKITPLLFFIGLIPGVLATVIGNMLSGIGIFKRETANLIKELEV